MENKYKGIAIFGGMGSGKDTFAEILLSLQNNSSIYNIGYICREIMKISKVNEKWTNRNRELLQIIASKLREIDEDILNDYTYSEAISNDSFPIIVGGRTFECYNYWSSRNFLIVGITADYNTRIKRLLERDSEFNENDLKHKTEVNTDYIVNNLCSVVIENNKDLEHLKLEAKKLLDLI